MNSVIGVKANYELEIKRLNEDLNKNREEFENIDFHRRSEV